MISNDMTEKTKLLLPCLLFAELAIPITIMRFDRPWSTWATISLWGLTNYIFWRVLSRQNKKAVQGVYLVVSSVILSLLCGVFLILVRPATYLKVTETQFILNRTVIETTASAILVVFVYTILYRIIGAVLLSTFNHYNTKAVNK